MGQREKITRRALKGTRGFPSHNFAFSRVQLAGRHGTRGPASQKSGGRLESALLFGSSHPCFSSSAWTKPCFDVFHDVWAAEHDQTRTLAKRSSRFVLLAGRNNLTASSASQYSVTANPNLTAKPPPHSWAPLILLKLSSWQNPNSSVPALNLPFPSISISGFKSMVQFAVTWEASTIRRRPSACCCSRVDGPPWIIICIGTTSTPSSVPSKSFLSSSSSQTLQDKRKDCEESAFCSSTRAVFSASMTA